MISIRVRILAAVTAVALTGTALALLPAATSAHANQRAPERCHRSDLDVRAGLVEGAAGSTYRRINFVNTGEHPCTLRGWPTITFRGAAGHRIGKESSRTPSRHPLVTVPAGGRAHANVRVPNPGNFTPSDCRARQAHEIWVTPPHRRFTVRLAWTIDVCSKPAGRTSVDAVHRGSP